MLESSFFKYLGKYLLISLQILLGPQRTIYRLDMVTMRLGLSVSQRAFKQNFTKYTDYSKIRINDRCFFFYKKLVVFRPPKIRNEIKNCR